MEWIGVKLSLILLEYIHFDICGLRWIYMRTQTFVSLDLHMLSVYMSLLW
jgi:hypothetical protein